MSDEQMLRAAKALARLALGNNYIPKEFTGERGRQWLEAEAPGLPPGIDAIGRLTSNGVLRANNLGATSFYRFSLDPVAEFLAAEAYFDQCENDEGRVKALFASSQDAQGFNNALLLIMQARPPGGSSAHRA